MFATIFSNELLLKFSATFLKLQPSVQVQISLHINISFLNILNSVTSIND